MLNTSIVWPSLGFVFKLYSDINKQVAFILHQGIVQFISVKRISGNVVSYANTFNYLQFALVNFLKGLYSRKLFIGFIGNDGLCMSGIIPKSYVAFMGSYLLVPSYYM